MKPVLIEWEDAWILPGKQDIDILPCSPELTHTLGFILEENKQGILLASEVWPEDKEHVSGPFFIPRKMIVRIIPLMAEPEAPADHVA